LLYFAKIYANVLKKLPEKLSDNYKHTKHRYPQKRDMAQSDNECRQRFGQVRNEIFNFITLGTNVQHKENVNNFTDLF
jgi:hypothetical protein